MSSAIETAFLSDRTETDLFIQSTEKKKNIFIYVYIVYIYCKKKKISCIVGCLVIVTNQ